MKQLPKLSEDLRKLLCNEALIASQNAYAPYSKFRVGAAVLVASGAIYRGVNIENSSYGLGICAERVAIANACTNGETDILAIAIACVDAEVNTSLEERMPCGACRQWFQELSPNAHIIIVGEIGSFAIDQLMPYPFKLRS